MVIRYEIEFKGRTLSVTQDINPDGGSATANKKPEGKVKPRPEEEQIAFSRRAEGVDLAAHAGQQNPLTAQQSQSVMPAAGAHSESPNPGGGANPESPGPGGGGSFNGLVIVFGPVIVPPTGGPGGGGGGNPEGPGPG
jgi:hypothetical protein